MFVGFFIFSGLGITFGYHRLLSHRAFEASWPVRLLSLLSGATAMEDSALNWCSDHRRHHKHTDHDHDPYNIQLGFWHAHIGWIMFRRDLEKTLDNVKDLERDPLIRWQHRWWAVIGIGLGFGLPTLLGYMLDGVLGAWAGLLIGGMARLVAVHHCTFLSTASAIALANSHILLPTLPVIHGSWLCSPLEKAITITITSSNTITEMV